MNNYIINPSIFYWMTVLNTIRGITIFISLMSFAALVIGIIFYFVEIDDGEDEVEVAKKYRKLILIAGISVVIGSMIIIFIPDKNTSMEMLIARTATRENTQLTIQGIKEIVDYVIQAIHSI